MIKQKSLIGMELDFSFRTIEAGHLNRLNQALFSSSANLSKTPETNKSEGYQNYPPFLLGNLINLPTIYKTLSLNINQLLLSRESIICHHTFKVGDIIGIRTFLKDVYEQQATSNPIGFIILESTGVVKDDLAFYVERVIAVRGGFQRGRAS
jgi:hypothetical protein